MDRNYGCVKCQCRHYSGQHLFDEHIRFQSKHGFMHSAQYEPFRPKSSGSHAGVIVSHEAIEDKLATIAERRLAERQGGFDRPSAFDRFDEGRAEE